MGGTDTCVLCGVIGHEIKSCPKLEVARAALKCDLCNANGHVVENCPNLAAAQSVIKPKVTDKAKPASEHGAIRRLSENGTILHFTNGECLFDIRPSPNPWPNGKNRYLGVFALGNATKEIQLWSGTPGIVSRSPLVFENSVEFKITQGTGMISRAGGPGNYQRIPDHRGQIIRVVETDSNGDVTDVYIDYDDATATIGLGWITDFIPNQ